MARPTTKDKPDTLAILYEIATEVEQFQKLDKKANAYRGRAEKVKHNIFRALEAIPKEDFALYTEKIERIKKRINENKD